jgi:hypothetical protein
VPQLHHALHTAIERGLGFDEAHLVAPRQGSEGALVQEVSAACLRAFPSIYVSGPHLERVGVAQQLLFVKQVLIVGQEVLQEFLLAVHPILLAATFKLNHILFNAS